MRRSSAPTHGSSSARTRAALRRRTPGSAPGGKARTRPPPPRRCRPCRRSRTVLLRPTNRGNGHYWAPEIGRGHSFPVLKPVTLSAECQLLTGGLIAIVAFLLGYLLCTGPRRR